ncbi:MAG: DNA polymerase III subunit gamma/tau [Steroidobacteraceae bacterium]
MAYTALARKWRPRRFGEMTGQEHVLQALANALGSGRVHHAFLFAGTRGVGKTTVARILAKCLNCEAGVTAEPCGECASCREIDAGRSVDVLEVDAASRTKIDDTRELLDNVQYAPSHSRYKIYLIDEVHMLSTHSFNALLKTLEEPPPHVKFLLATTDPQKLPVTVLSRCLQFNLKRLSVGLIAARLRHILEAEQIEFEPAALQLVAHAGDGSLRDALSLLDQLLAYGNGRATEAEARAMLGTVDREYVLRLLRCLAKADPAALYAELQALEQWSPDYGQLLDQMASLLERVALKQAVSGYEGDELHALELLNEFAAAIASEDVQLYYQIAILGRRDLAWAPDPATGFRMTLIRMLAFRPQPDGAGPGAGAGQPAARGAARPAASAGAAAVSVGSAPGRGVGAVTDAPMAAAAGDATEWPAIVAALELGGPARALASHCALLGREGGSVKLALDPRHAALRTPQQEEKLNQALGKYFGQRVRVEFELRAAAQATPAQVQQRAQEQHVDAARAALENDPTVRTLKEQFGATLHPDSVRAKN